MNKKMKAYTLLATTFLALSPTTSFANESSQALFGTEPVTVAQDMTESQQEQTQSQAVPQPENALPGQPEDVVWIVPLDDYSYYVGTWYSRDGYKMTFDENGYDEHGGRLVKFISKESGESRIGNSGGGAVMAVPAGIAYDYSATADDISKDRLYGGNGAYADHVFYREADIATVKAAQETGTESVVAAASSQTLDEVVEESVVAEESVQATEEVKAEAPETDGQSLVETVEAVAVAESKPVTPVGQTEQVVEQSAPQQSQASVAQPSTQHLPKSGEKTGLWLSLLGGMAIVLGGVGMVLNLKRKNS